MGKKTRRLTNSVRDLRQRAGGMTQQQLADLVGITRQTVNSIESNRYSPSLEVAFMIARVFGARLDEVFHFGDDGSGDGSLCP